MRTEVKPSFFRSLVGRAAGVVGKTAVVATLGPQLGVLTLAAAQRVKACARSVRDEVNRLRERPASPAETPASPPPPPSATV
jgi:hypothetical protein